MTNGMSQSPEGRQREAPRTGQLRNLSDQETSAEAAGSPPAHPCTHPPGVQADACWGRGWATHSTTPSLPEGLRATWL